MSLILTLIHRNLRVFWRDRLSLLFGLIAPVVLFGMFVLFFRKVTAQLIAASINNTGFGQVTVDDVYPTCDAWMFASVTTLACFTGAIGMLTAFVDDRASGRFSDYLVAPIRRWRLGVAYVASTVIVTFVISGTVMLLDNLWAWIKDSPMMSGTALLQCMGGVLLSSLVFSALNTVAMTFTPSVGSFNGYALVTGTSMGFLAFCYVPPASLSDAVNNVMGSLPFAQSAALIREPAMSVALNPLLANIPEGPTRDGVHDSVMTALGSRLVVHGHVLTPTFITWVILGITVLLSALLIWRMSRVIH
ncbi:MAG: hypothetical protein FWF25_04205 [Propionibacteriaceae bacterium]|nr:hypothetical protein [Propionibacteriaceae bacterium]